MGWNDRFQVLLLTLAVGVSGTVLASTLCGCAAILEATIDGLLESDDDEDDDWESYGPPGWEDGPERRGKDRRAEGQRR